MNKLNTIIIFLLSFVLLSPVFTTTSYAELQPNVSLTGTPFTQYSKSSSVTYAGYTGYEIDSIIYNYCTNTDDIYVNDFNSLVESLHSSGYDLVVLDGGLSFIDYCFFYKDTVTLGVSKLNSSYCLFSYLDVSVDSNQFYFSTAQSSTNRYYYAFPYTSVDSFRYKNLYASSSLSVVYSDVDLLQFNSVNNDNTNPYYWDGESYFYRNSSEPDTPTFPTNAEIASAVQKFYNSDIYKNNTNFKDFIVVYSALKNTYAFIGTDNHILQEIFYDGVQVPGVDFSSSDTWWRFNSKFGDIQSFLFGNKFYLYFIEGDSDVITNEGTGTLYDLFRSKYSMNMTIVYSTYDYDVIEYRPPLEGETDNQVTSGTIQGDSYTYDENLDPTDNEYSPLQNYVPSDPTQSILNDVDFDSINQAFEDGKVILNIENASWIFTANNQLVEYFLGFISFLIVLIAISRVLGG